MWQKSPPSGLLQGEDSSQVIYLDKKLTSPEITILLLTNRGWNLLWCIEIWRRRTWCPVASAFTPTLQELLPRVGREGHPAVERTLKDEITETKTCASFMAWVFWMYITAYLKKQLMIGTIGPHGHLKAFTHKIRCPLKRQPQWFIVDSSLGFSFNITWYLEIYLVCWSR